MGINISTPFDFDSDTLWLFYYHNNIPTVCKYDQDDDRVESIMPLNKSIWHPLLPYFDRIITGTMNASIPHPKRFSFLLDDGHCIVFDLDKNKLDYLPINDSTWYGLAPYKDRIITAVQNDRSLAASHYYIFLTNNEYLRFDLMGQTLLKGPIKVNDVNWPGLLRG